MGQNSQGAIHVQAHRGASCELLENTLPAFDRAIEVGADSIELDVHVTQDGEVIVFHDFAFEPKHTKDKSGKTISHSILINGLKWTEVTGMDSVNAHRLRHPNTLSVQERRVPKLSEVFELFLHSSNPHAKKMIVDVEIKRDPSHPNWTLPPEKLVSSILKVILPYSKKVNCFVRSFDFRVLEELRRQAPEIPIAALTETVEGPELPLFKALKPQIWAPYFQELTSEEIGLAHQLGAKVIPYTVNQPESWERMIAEGVDGMTTDDPRGLIAYLMKSNRR